MKRRAVITALVLLVLGAGAIIACGRPRALVGVEGEVRSLAVTRAGVFWIAAPGESGGGPARVLHLPHGSREATELLRAHDVRSLFVLRSEVWALVETGAEEGSGELRRIRPEGSEVIADGLHSPQGLWVMGGSAGGDARTVYWTESRSARAEGIAHVPVMRPLHVVRVADATELRPRLLGVVEGAEPHFLGRLLGVREGKLYWTEPTGWGFPGRRTLVMRGAAGSEPEMIATVKGAHVAGLSGDVLHWTAHSEELAVPPTGRVVRRLDLRHGEPETLTDWMPARGELLVDGGRAYVSGERRVWAVPRTLDEAAPLFGFTGEDVRALSIHRKNLYGVEQWREAPWIVRRPLSWRGYLGAAGGGREG